MQLAKRGAAMLAALLFLVVASGIITLMFTSTLSEIRHSGDDIAIVQALTLARGGMNLGGGLLQGAVRDELETLTLKEASTVERFPFGSSPNISDPEPSAASVIADLKQKVTVPMQGAIDNMLCGTPGTVSPKASQKVSIKVYVTDTACGDKLPKDIKLPAARYVSGQTRTYAIPFILVAEATIGSSFKRTIASQGEYQFTVGGGKFSQYALFTDEHVGPANQRVWFTDQTNYDGRVHTNTTFRIAFEPWFGEKATSAGCINVVPATDAEGKPTTECADYNQGATFLSKGFIKAEDIGDPPVYGNDKPQFTQGVDWRADYVPLPENALDQEAAAQATGLVIGSDLYSLTLYAGDASGDPLSSDGNGGWTPAATHQYIEVCEAPSACELYRYGPNKELYQEKILLDHLGNPYSTWTLKQSNFNGLVYVEGKVDRFRGPERTPSTSSDPADTPPALASFATMTIVPEGDIRITGDIKYEDSPCSGKFQRVNGLITPAICNNLNAKNVLGVFTPDGDIMVGSQNADNTINAPHNVEIHGSFMASEGIFTTENFFKGAPRGNINLLGGIIEQRYGPTGRFNRATGDIVNGYKINVSFDQRMALDYSPPFFPGTGPSDIQGVFIYSFGQREQVF